MFDFKATLAWKPLAVLVFVFRLVRKWTSHDMVPGPILPLEVALEPTDPSRYADLVTAVTQMIKHDPSTRLVTVPGAHGIVLAGISEEYLERRIGDIRRDYGTDLIVSQFQVAHRETLSRPVSIKYTHKRARGGSGEFAGVSIDFEPLPRGTGFVFVNRIVNEAIPNEFILSVEKGLREQKEFGLIAGFPVIDFEATLTDGRYHEVDSNVRTFELAARAAFQELTKEDVVTLLEPVMNVEVVTPAEFVGAVADDLKSRRGTVEATETRGQSHVVMGKAPLSSLLGFGKELVSMTGGRATHTLRFSHYEPVPVTSPDGNFPMAAAKRVA